MIKERDQNLVVGDDVALRLFTYNSNHRQNVYNVEKVEIYHLDKSSITNENPEGRILLKTINQNDINIVDDPFGGQYSIEINLEEQAYVIGDYLDIWYVNFNQLQSGTVTNEFRVLPDLWFASGTPIIYDFSFGFRPNRIRYGERRWLNIDILPNVPHVSDLKKYYTNLAVSSPLRIYIEKLCGDCVPQERDLRMVVDGELVVNRRGSEGSFFINTEELEMTCGIYNVWFEMEFGENKYLSDNLQLQIY